MQMELALLVGTHETLTIHGESAHDLNWIGHVLRKKVAQEGFVKSCPAGKSQKRQNLLHLAFCGKPSRHCIDEMYAAAFPSFITGLLVPCRNAAHIMVPWQRVMPIASLIKGFLATCCNAPHNMVPWQRAMPIC
jgi:hypothetical protein